MLPIGADMNRRGYYLLLAFILVCPVAALLVKFVPESIVAMHATDESAKWLQIVPMLDQSLNQYVESNGHCPTSLTDLQLRNLPLNLDDLHYTYSNNVCVIRFTGKYVNRYHTRNYTDVLKK